MAETAANTEVNVNMIQGYHQGRAVVLPADYGMAGASVPANITGVTTSYAKVSPTIESGKSVAGYYTRVGETDNYVAASGTSDGTTDYYEKLISGTIASAIGTIGNVYGGGQQGQVKGNTKVNIGNLSEVQILHRNSAGFISDASNNPIYDENGKLIKDKVVAYDNYTVRGVHIDGDVYGGGEMALVTGSSEVNICTAETSPGSGTYVSVAEGAEKVTIGGSVYGGGSQADVLTNTTVRMYNGYVFDGVYGGGLLGSVGTFTRDETTTDYGHTTHDDCLGKPTACAANTGLCTVVVNGGQIGPVEVALTTGGMRNTGNLAGYDGPVDVGFVFGAGRGEVENPAVDPDTHFRTFVNNTDVTIGGTALIMASVYGGGENGRVLGDTHVTIAGGQIGCGEGSHTGSGTTADPYVAQRYTDGQFINPLTTVVTSGAGGNALAETPHWLYGIDTNNDDIKDTFLPYDPYAGESFYETSYGPAGNPASNGRTYYGSVFGGGSGYFPYEIKSGDVVTGYEWLRSAGVVYGNTHLTITGGHILTNAYGGNETTDVMGTCYVSMSGGTLGVPRTVEQILENPQPCYLFGAGKGVPRKHFAGWTNVNHVVLSVTGGIIYGSVFGGAEDGHVRGHVRMTIGNDDGSGPIIGTWGTSYVDGNVFGGGRGFSGESYTGGNVAGSIKMDIKGGNMLGSIYGGGRLGSVGYSQKDNLMKEDTDCDDGEPDNFFTQDSYLDYNNQEIGFLTGRGHVEVKISGGTIGNKWEFKYNPSNTTIDAAYRTANHTPLTVFDGVRPLHTKGGNVFGGSMGRRDKLDGSVISVATDGIEWRKLGNVKTTKVTVSGTAWIKGNVYGGGEFGAVTGSQAVAGGVDLDGNAISAGTEILVQGGTIGTVMGSNINSGTGEWTPSPEVGTNDVAGDTRYAFGSIYGGGYGTEVEATLTTNDIEAFSAYVNSNTYINMSSSDAKVRGSVYGGGEFAGVKGNTHVFVSNGHVGINQVRMTAGDKKDYVLFGNWRMGNVYGGGRGSVDCIYSGLVRGNANVKVSGGGIYHNVYGGGALASVGNFDLSTDANKESYGLMFANIPVNWKNSDGTALGSGTGTPTGQARIVITGGTIGINGHDNGMVNGSSRGDISTNKPATDGIDPYDRVAWIDNAIVTIGDKTLGTVLGGAGSNFTSPLIKGSVYGGGENGHNFGGAVIAVHSGKIGDADTPSDTWFNRGNIFGAGCGTDTYGKNTGGTTFTDGFNHYNPMGGRILGNASVTIDGGWITLLMKLKP